MAEAGIAAPAVSPRYKWVALSNTTLGVFMSVLDSSIVTSSPPSLPLCRCL